MRQSNFELVKGTTNWDFCNKKIHHYSAFRLNNDVFLLTGNPYLISYANNSFALTPAKKKDLVYALWKLRFMYLA